MARGDEVVGIDNLNNYYDVQLKKDRLAAIPDLAGSDLKGSFEFHKLDLTDLDGLKELFETEQFDSVINMAAQAGVRHSIDHPHRYASSNLAGFLNVLECCRHHPVEHLVFASSSSVYGANEKMPFSESDNVDHPISFYAATKKANELMAHCYAALHGVPCTGLRFFTVYGPWGRPDMAFITFTKKILAGEPIDVFNHGEHKRDFTYIDDIVEGVVRVLDRPPSANTEWSALEPDPASSSAPWRIFNIGHSQPVELGFCIDVLEAELGVEAKKNFLPRRRGEVEHTYADVSTLDSEVGYRPQTVLQEGIQKFVTWYKNYYL